MFLIYLIEEDYSTQPDMNTPSQGGSPLSALRTSPPNPTMKIWGAKFAINSSDLPAGCFARGEQKLGVTF
jgi:hypothetical protein